MARTHELPKDTFNTVYMRVGMSSFNMEEVEAKALVSFDITAEQFRTEVELEVENIQETGCLCHHDSSDWTMYLVLRHVDAKPVSEDATLLVMAVPYKQTFNEGVAKAHWPLYAQELLNRGYSLEDAEDFLKSHHIDNIAKDAFDLHEEKATVNDLRNYLDRIGN